MIAKVQSEPTGRHRIGDKRDTSAERRHLARSASLRSWSSEGVAKINHAATSQNTRSCEAQPDWIGLQGGGKFSGENVTLVLSDGSQVPASGRWGCRSTRSMPWASCSENKPMSDRLSHSQIAVLVAYLAFALTPALGGLVFAEPMSMRLVIGIVLILGGLLLVAG